MFLTHCRLALNHFIDFKSESIFKEKDLERNVVKTGECILIFDRFTSNLVFVLEDERQSDEMLT